jgi:hypothetical protein
MGDIVGSPTSPDERARTVPAKFFRSGKSEHISFGSGTKRYGTSDLFGKPSGNPGPAEYEKPKGLKATGVAKSTSLRNTDTESKGMNRKLGPGLGPGTYELAGDICKKSFRVQDKERQPFAGGRRGVENMPSPVPGGGGAGGGMAGVRVRVSTA